MKDTYIMNMLKQTHKEYINGWDRFTLFADTLHDELIEMVHMFHLEPFASVDTKRHIAIDFEGREIQTEITVRIYCEYTEVNKVSVVLAEVMDSELNDLAQEFDIDFYKILNNALNYSLIS